MELNLKELSVLYLIIFGSTYFRNFPHSISKVFGISLACPTSFECNPVLDDQWESLISSCSVMYSSQTNECCWLPYLHTSIAKHRRVCSWSKSCGTDFALVFVNRNFSQEILKKRTLTRESKWLNRKEMLVRESDFVKESFTVTTSILLKILSRKFL